MKKFLFLLGLSHFGIFIVHQTPLHASQSQNQEEEKTWKELNDLVEKEVTQHKNQDNPHPFQATFKEYEDIKDKLIPLTKKNSEFKKI